MPDNSKLNKTATTKSSSPIVRSALWAAWGDALGFPCELVSDSMLRKRLPDGFDGKLHPWTRRIGGRMGAMIELPEGIISDDTQLRLATSRCIRRSGHFDAEAFSKIELSVFLTYQLGAGRGTKTAAKTLSRRDARWYSNFFDTGDQKYVNGGGNGAAMRIQPHVWAAALGKADTFMPSLLRDTVCTHGHLVGILGAALHGVALWSALREREIPSPKRWLGMVGFLEVIDEAILSDEMLASRWIPVWEQKTGKNFKEELSVELDSLSELMKTAMNHIDMPNANTNKGYFDLAKKLGGIDPSTRGAGTISAVLALWLSWIHREKPTLAVETCASCLGSDTDTVATMVGALVGAVADSNPPQLPIDSELIALDALRLEQLSLGENPDSFPHPDTLHWQPPKSLSDALGKVKNKTLIAGLGPVSLSGKKHSGQGKNAGLWQWVHTDYGQTLLVKRRTKLPNLEAYSAPRHRPGMPTMSTSDTRNKRLATDSQGSVSSLPMDPADGVKLLVENGFDTIMLRNLFMHYAELGRSPASKFATLFSDYLLSQPKSSSTRKTNKKKIKEQFSTSEIKNQSELNFKSDDSAS